MLMFKYPYERKYSSSNDQFWVTFPWQDFFPDISLTIPWLLTTSPTFPWHVSNSLTFPGFPDKWSPWKRKLFCRQIMNVHRSNHTQQLQPSLLSILPALLTTLEKRVSLSGLPDYSKNYEQTSTKLCRVAQQGPKTNPLDSVGDPNLDLKPRSFSQDIHIQAYSRPH